MVAGVPIKENGGLEGITSSINAQCANWRHASGLLCNDRVLLRWKGHFEMTIACLPYGVVCLKYLGTWMKEDPSYKLDLSPFATIGSMR